MVGLPTSQFKALITVPVGPVETAPIWFAPCRLGINVWAAHFWGKGIDPRGLWVVLISRVANHSAAYAIACTERALAIAAERAGDLANLGDRIHSYSDGGPHFKCYRYIGSMACAAWVTAKKNLTLTFGAENHFKNPCDGLFGLRCREPYYSPRKP